MEKKLRYIGISWENLILNKGGKIKMNWRDTEFMDGLILIEDKIELKKRIISISRELDKEGFNDGDIREYLEGLIKSYIPIYKGD